MGQDGRMNAPDLTLIANAGDATISAFALQDDRLHPLATTTLPGSCSTFAVDADRNLVHAFTKGDVPTVVTLQLDPVTGVLTERHRVDCGAAMAYLTLARSGTLLLGASYHGGTGAVWPVVDGVIGDAVSTIAHPNLHCVVTTADGAYAYFVSLGADLIAQYALDAGGALTPLDPPTVSAPAGSGPRHLVLSSDETRAYLVTEFSGEAIAFERDADGRLSALGAASFVDSTAGLAHSRFGANPAAEHLIWGADVHLARDETYLLATERTASTLATLAVDGSGRLGAQVAIRPTQAQPRGFAVTPDGTRAVVVGERSTTATLYAVNEDGTLRELDRQETGRGANWVRVLSGSALRP